MDQDSSSANEVLQRQITLMRELAGSLQRAQAAVLSSDMGQMGAQTLRQQRLCEELQRQGCRMPCGTSALVRAARPLQPLSNRQQSLLIELQQTAKLVDRLNRDYAALLRRARRTVDIFCRVLASSAITYLPPARPAQSPLQDSKG